MSDARSSSGIEELRKRFEAAARAVSNGRSGDIRRFYEGAPESDICAAYDALCGGAQAAPEPDDWREDPSADERWNAGVDFVMKLLCDFLGVDPDDVTWDAATETVDGDVSAVIGNILRTKYGEDWGPSDGAIYAAASKAETPDDERADMMRDIDAKLEGLRDPAYGQRDAVIEECAKHLEACGFRYSQGFDLPDSLRRLKGSALPSTEGK